MSRPEELYRLPVTSTSVSKFSDICSGYIDDYGQAMLLPNGVPTEGVRFRINDELEIALLKVHIPSRKLAYGIPSIIRAEFHNLAESNEVDYLIHRHGVILRYPSDFNETVKELGITDTRYVKIQEFEAGLYDMTEGELLDVLDQVEGIDPETQLVGEK